MSSPPVDTTALVTRVLGRTGRRITTFGLGGQASIQWTPEGVDPVAIIEKAYRLGVTYYDTSNVYGPSQTNFGAAFRNLDLVPGTPNYGAAARKRIFLASKTHIRTSRVPESERWPTSFSEGMMDGFNCETAADDVRRSLSQMFGDGQGGYPEGAYLDLVQIHNINGQHEVDMIYEGLDDPTPERPWLGALVGLRDLRDGTNHSGTNPKNEQLVRHIGITGHWNSAAHIYAIQRDTRRMLDTLLVALNASDRAYLAHRHNAIPVAEAAGMGIIAMKVFADAAYYHKDVRFSMTSEDVYREVGSEAFPSEPLIQYPLSVPGVTTAIIGIGHIDPSDDPTKCQLTSNIAAAQMEVPLSEETQEEIERRVKQADTKGANAYFQLPALGLTPPRNVGAEPDTCAEMFGRRAVRVTWDTAYAGKHAVHRYEVLRDGEVIGNVPHTPQWTRDRFTYDDVFDDYGHTEQHTYVVRTVDTEEDTAESPSIAVTP